MVKTDRPAKSREAAKPFSIRLTASEKDFLTAKAGTTPLGLFIRNRLLSDAAAPRASRRAAAPKDLQALARVLAILGRSRLAVSLNDLAAVAASGSLHVEPDTKGVLHRACDDIHAMRLLLMEALGLKTPSDWREWLSLSETFAENAENQTP